MDVEEVGEVRVDLDLDQQIDVALGEIEDVVVLVHAAGDRPVEPDREGVPIDLAVCIEKILDS